MFSYTDAGRAQSKRPRSKEDCTVRAVAIAYGMPFDEAYDLLAKAGRQPHRKFNFKVWANAQPNLRWHVFQAVKGELRMKPETFIRQFRVGIYILKTAKHVFTVIDGVIYDEERNLGRCVYGCWEIVTTGAL